MQNESPALKPGDFTGLASAYAQYRPGYAPTVAARLVALIGKPAREIVAADVGAGTGIWSRQLAATVGRVTAVEPNADMRRHGEAQSSALGIQFRAGSGEATGLEPASFDLVTMASSFHWVDTDRGLSEFHRILRPGGRFAALWNPRVIEDNPVFSDIESQIKTLKPDLKRVSSGNSEFTETLMARLQSHSGFDDVSYFEDRHVEYQSRDRYIGLWNSVNDVQTQLGPANWATFMSYVAQRTAGIAGFSVTYRTRVWTARRRA